MQKIDIRLEQSNKTKNDLHLVMSAAVVVEVFSVVGLGLAVVGFGVEDEVGGTVVDFSSSEL